MLGEKIGESGKVTARGVLRSLGGDPKMETSFQAEWIGAGHRRKGDRHVFDHGPSRRDTIRRRSRG